MWMNLENTMLSERSGTQKATHCIIYLMYMKSPEQANPEREKERSGFPGAEGRGGTEQGV